MRKILPLLWMVGALFSCQPAFADFSGPITGVPISVTTLNATTGNIINTTGNAVLSVQGQQQSGGGAYIRVRDTVLGTMGYFGENAAINGGTVYNQIDIQNPQAAGTVCISGNAVASSSAGPTGCDLFINATDQVVIANFGTATATTVCQNAGLLSLCSSARRFKENIVDAYFGLSDVLKMRPVYFDWKDHKENPTEQHDFGAIAEDMAAINPIFATYDKDGQIIGVKYERLTLVLAAAIKELFILLGVLTAAFIAALAFIFLKLRGK